MNYWRQSASEWQSWIQTSDAHDHRAVTASRQWRGMTGCSWMDRQLDRREDEAEAELEAKSTDAILLCTNILNKDT